ncbi:MAG: efflux RND transporter periplasmic adaptor subunit [Acidobacteriaceae bacterium]|nr:efflux RND transporter periplasmic adaptor subunit [Acidobacteriaceae bacterium]
MKYLLAAQPFPAARRMHGGTAAVALVTAFALAGCNKDAPKAAPGGGLPVSYITAAPSDVPLKNEWVGTLDGNVNAQIQPQVTGYLVAQKYREGSVVSKGEVLFQIDRRPFEAALAQAQGQVGQAQGQLAQAQAAEQLAKINVNRDSPLAEQRAIAQSQLDNDKQQLATAEANIATATASIASAKAAVQTATLNLGFTEVRSLISGVAGQATTQVGNLVSPQTTLTAVSQLDPIRVYFSMSDNEYLTLTSRARQNSMSFDKDISRIELSLVLADGSTYPHKGHIAFVDRGMNQQTGAIRIAALFPNPGNVLRPGQFGRVSANTETLHDAIVLPQAAVNDLQGEKQVYTLTSDNKVHIVPVVLGPETKEGWVIKSGIQSGTHVAIDQLQKLKEGMPVSAQPAKADASTAQGR